MKLLVIGHTYIAPINRDKWKVFARQFPADEVQVIIPTEWHDTLFTLYAGDCAPDNLPNCRFTPLAAQRAGNEVLYGYKLTELIKILRSFKPDVIYVEQGDNSWSYLQTIFCAKLFAHRARLAFFTWINWVPQVSFKYRLIWRWVERINRWFSAGAIVGNHDALLLLRRKGFTQPITVLPQLGVETIDNQMIPAYKLDSFETDEQTRYVAFIGRLVPEKGIYLLLEAMAELAPQFPSWRLLMVGRGPERDRFKEAIKQHRLTDRVVFKDSVSHHEVFSLLKSVDILALPSYDTPEWREQFGHIIIEAMVCGIPVIGSTGGEIQHVIADAGLIAEQNNLKSLIECLSKLMNNENLRKEIGKKGYERVMHHYTHEKIAEQTHTFLRSLILTR